MGDARRALTQRLRVVALALGVAGFFTTLDLVTHNAPAADLHYFQVTISLHGDFLQW